MEGQGLLAEGTYMCKAERSEQRERKTEKENKRLPNEFRNPGSKTQKKSHAKGGSQ